MSNMNNADSHALITGTSDNDNIYNSGTYSTIVSAEGDDSIDNFAVHVLIDAGEGNDGIFNKGSIYTTIYGGAGNDEITNYASRTTVNAGEGDDYINSAQGSLVTIAGGDGSDTIVSNSQRASINGGDGDDIIQLTGSATTVRGGKGDDTIIGSDRYTDHFQYARGDGNDIITNYNTNDFIQITSGTISNASVSGDDYILFVGNGSLTIQNALNKQIKLIDKNKDIYYLNPGDFVRTNIDEASITGTDFPDEINNGYEAGGYNSGSNVTINSAGGNDTINNKGNKVYIDAGSGGDKINNYGSETTIFAADGNDLVKNYGSQVSIDGGDGNDKFYNYYNASYSNINAAAGKDSIFNYASNSQINGEDDEDYISNVSSGNNSTLSGGNGDDIIRNSTVNEVYISGGAGNDSIYSGGKDVTINGGTGDDTIRCFKGNNSTDNQIIQYSEGDGSDVIFGYNTDDTIQITSGNIKGGKISGVDVLFYISDDILTIKNGKNRKITILDSTGNLTSKIYDDNSFPSDVVNTPKVVTIEGSDNDDRIFNRDINALVNGGNGDDYMINYSNAHNSTLNGGDGNDTIKNSNAEEVLISGGSGDDSLYGSGNKLTINGGTGDDTIRCLSGKQIIQYAEGDGSDIIYGYNTEDTIQITSGNIKGGKISGTDVLFYIGDDILTIKNAKNKKITILDSEGNLTSAKYDDSSFPEDVVNIGKINTIEGSDSDDRIYNRDINGLINGGNGDDYIINYSNAHNSTLNGGDGNDTIKNSNANEVLINGGSGNDSLYSSGNKVTINAGVGDDTIRTVSGKQLIQYAEGDGNDVIYGFNTKDTIQLTSGNITGSSYIGDDVLYYIGDGSLLLKNAINQNIAVADAEGNVEILNGLHFPDNITVNSSYSMMTVGSTFEGTIDLNNYKNLKTVTADSDCSVFVIGNDKANVLYAGGVGGTLQGGTANDVLYGGAGTDVLVYDKGDGNDTFYKYDTSDSIQLSSDITVSRVSVSGRNVILYFDGGGSVKISDAKGKAITITGESKDAGTYTFTQSTKNGIVDSDTTVNTPAFIEKNIIENWFTNENYNINNEIDSLIENKLADNITNYKLDDKISLENDYKLHIANNELIIRGEKNGK